MFLRRSLASLVKFLFSVGTFGGLAPPPPPPNTKKLATLVMLRWQKKYSAWNIHASEMTPKKARISEWSEGWVSPSPEPRVPPLGPKAISFYLGQRFVKMAWIYWWAPPPPPPPPNWRIPIEGHLELIIDNEHSLPVWVSWFESAPGKALWPVCVWYRHTEPRSDHFWR